MPLGKRKARGKFPGTAKRLKYGARRRFARRRFVRPRRMRSVIKKTVLSVSETKYKHLSFAIPTGTSAGLVHNQLAEIVLWSSLGGIWPGQGDGEADRSGNSIYATGIRLRGYFNIPGDRKNVRIKMWFVPYNNNQGNPSTKSEFYYSQTDVGLIDPVQSRRFPGMRFLGTFNCKDTGSVTTSQDSTILVDKWIPLKRKLDFRDNTSAVATNIQENGKIIILPYDTYSTSQATDAVVKKWVCAPTLYFKDP